MSKEGDSRVPRGLGSLDTHFGVLGVTNFKQSSLCVLISRTEAGISSLPPMHVDASSPVSSGS